MRGLSCFVLGMVMLAANGAAQETEGNLWDRFTDPYRAPGVPAHRAEDTARLKRLIRDGRLDLSLDDAISLAIENNLDVAVQRYLPLFASSDVTRSQAGALLRGLQLSVREGPAGIGGPSSPVLTGSIDNTNSQADVSLSLGQLGNVGTSSLASGPPVPSFDPLLNGQLSWTDRTSPQPSQASYGTDSLETHTGIANLGLLKGFSTGGQFAFSITNNRLNLNSNRLDLNPYTTASVGLTVTQPLLQGFGKAVSERYIRIALTNQKVADLAFRQQLVATVAGVLRLYYDLVSVRLDVEVKQQALKRAETLLENNRIQVEVGTLPPIEVSRAQAEVARSRQALTNSESLVLQQEVILKNYLSRRGTEDPEIRQARIQTLDRIQIPDREAPKDLERLAEQAFLNRPDYLQATLQIDNARTALNGARSALAPQLNLVGYVQNNALAGEMNTLAPEPAVYPQLTGGYGDLLSQLFRRRYPDYGVFLQLNIPLGNRQARADMFRDQAVVNQADLRLEQLRHQIRTEVEAAIIALDRARAASETARQNRILQDEALQAEQERYAVGASTSFFVIQYQRDLAQARSDEVIAESQYAKAKTALERATGMILDAHHIDFGEAYRGEMNR